MKIIFFGMGSIGKRHAQLLLDSGEHDLFAFRSSRDSGPHGLKITDVYSWDEVKNIGPNVAFITNPTYLHIETALRCADMGMHLFIEKPLSNTLKGINKLEIACKEKGLTGYVAYCLRFHPVIEKIHKFIAGKEVYHIRVTCSSFLPHWRKNQNFRKSYSVFNKQGGGVVLDLSHEFDYVSYLFGEIKKVKGVYGKASDLTCDSEDFADILITLSNSIQANLHLNYLSLNNERIIKIDFKGGYIVGDLISNTVQYFYNNKLQKYTFNINENVFFKKQTEYFLNNLGNQEIMNNIGEAKQLLAKILGFKNA